LLETYSSKALCAYTDKAHTRASPVKLRTSDLLVLSNMKLRMGANLVAVGLRRPVFECESDVGATGLPRWFVLEPQPRYLGSSMEFIQQVPTAETGLPSYLFWYSGHNEDGYVIFDAHLQDSSRFTWKYH
jgi:hypothetical protein